MAALVNFMTCEINTGSLLRHNFELGHFVFFGSISNLSACKDEFIFVYSLKLFKEVAVAIARPIFRIFTCDSKMLYY